MSGILVVYLIWLSVASVAALYLYANDKKRARQDRPRRRESVLLGIAACGGAFGAEAGRLLFRHKTNKVYFSLVNRLSLAIQVGVLVFLIVLGGAA